MKASIVDLRYHMKDVLSALDRNESVEVLYHGKLRAFLVPATKQKKKHRMKVAEHPYFGSMVAETEPVEEVIKKLRRNRHHDL